MPNYSEFIINVEMLQTVIQQLNAGFRPNDQNQVQDKL